MKILLLALLTAFSQARAAGPVGIDEKLGAQAPLDLPFADERGGPATLRKLVDRPTILVLVYYRCAGVCTPILMGLTRTLSEMELEPGRDYKVVTVSFDPEDTPELARLKRANFLRQFHRPFPPQAWRFLTGSGENSRKLADALGFGFLQRGQEYIHPAAIMVLSPQGKLTRYLYGTSFLPYDLQMAISEASQGLARPSIGKFSQFCYTADPAGRGKVFALTRVMGALMLAAAGSLWAFLALTGRKKS